MATYVYETIPSDPAKTPRRFEVRQSMKDAPLSHDPGSGEPVRRVITGGYGYIGPSKGESPASRGHVHAHAGHGGCGGGCGCGHSH